MPDLRCEAGCGRRATTDWWDETRDLEWHLCGWHSDHTAETLVHDGYQLVIDERHDIVHPSLGPVTSDYRSH